VRAATRQPPRLRLGRNQQGNQAHPRRTARRRHDSRPRASNGPRRTGRRRAPGRGRRSARRSPGRCPPQTRWPARRAWWRRARPAAGPAPRQTRAAWRAPGRPPARPAAGSGRAARGWELAARRARQPRLGARVLAAVGDGVRGGVAAQVLLVVDEACARPRPQRRADRGGAGPCAASQGRALREQRGRARRDVVGDRRAVVGHKADRHVGACAPRARGVTTARPQGRPARGRRGAHR